MRMMINENEFPEMLVYDGEYYLAPSGITQEKALTMVGAFFIFRECTLALPEALFLCCMNTANLTSTINKAIELTEEETAFFVGLLLPMKVRQGEMLEKPGEATKYFIHVVSGCLMTYYTDKEDVDHVIQFAQVGWWTGDTASLTKQIPSIYSTRALSDSEVLLLPKTGMDQLLEQHVKFEKYFRILFQNSLVTHQDRLIQNFSATAEERYLSFQKKYPSLEQYVPQKYIASYLGITPEFLSKIRRKLAENR